MTVQWTGICWVISAYLLGAIPFGYLLVRLKQGKDIRAVGSGNIGATNVLRATGRPAALLTLALDTAKGYLAVLGASYFTNQSRQFVALAASAVIVGHVFPVYLKFKGGKGVATSMGVFFYLASLPILGSIVIFLVAVAIWRFVSLGSILGTAAFPILYFLMAYRREPSFWTLLAAVFCSSLVIFRHKDNIKRLVAGTESKLTGLKK
jgi:glycerol-3-phosphate acyltransferase PlsY